jgi:methyl-accepting chemotaxis protein
MEFMRRVSLVRRVTIGFSTMAASIAAVGGTALSGLDRHSAVYSSVAAMTACGVTAALVGGWLIRASIRSSVESTIHCVIQIAKGDLETKIESPGKDEISWLRAELNGMRKKLRTMVLEVRQTVGEVTTAANEIAAGNSDLSSRTETQASALQETAASMEQLASTVRSNAGSTAEARAFVTESNEVAARGAQMMQDVVRRMADIDASAGKISEIVGVIDGIAFQTNILALNAAVEAARAGEQGRGFAVVASEVRALAQRSSTAAREIKALIGASSEQVGAGSKLVGAAGRTMEEIVVSVDRVSGLIADIASAGQTQSSDIGTVHAAVSQIDTMTQQNAALVEKLSASAQALQTQSLRLGESMGVFRLAA